VQHSKLHWRFLKMHPMNLRTKREIYFENHKYALVNDLGEEKIVPPGASTRVDQAQWSVDQCCRSTG
jgi:hypothetical protein